MGRALDNALLNLGLKGEFAESVDKLGFNLEDLIGEIAFQSLPLRRTLYLMGESQTLSVTRPSEMVV